MHSLQSNLLSEQQNHTVISSADFPLIPEEAFLYFPTDQEIKSGEGKTAVRRIFEGHVEFDEFEKQQLLEFETYLAKKQILLNQWWNDSRKLRFLQANGFKLDKTAKTIEVHQQWRNESLPPQLTDQVHEFLQKGAFYTHGRDHRFRPILIINVKKLNFKELTSQRMQEGMTYLYEFVLSKMMLPGQIENWVVIIDLGNIGISSLPLGELKSMMVYLSQNYRSRMFAAYVVNTPSSIFIPYRIIKGFLEETTIKKISFYSDSIPKPLLTHANPSQIEYKYSGSAPTKLNSFWPPTVVSKDYQLETRQEELTKLFHSKEEYIKRYQSGKLVKNMTLREHITVKEEVGSNAINPDIKENSFSYNKDTSHHHLTNLSDDIIEQNNPHHHKLKHHQNHDYPGSENDCTSENQKQKIQETKLQKNNENVLQERNSMVEFESVTGRLEVASESFMQESSINQKVFMYTSKKAIKFMFH